MDLVRDAFVCVFGRPPVLGFLAFLGGPRGACEMVGLCQYSTGQVCDAMQMGQSGFPFPNDDELIRGGGGGGDQRPQAGDLAAEKKKSREE